MTTHSKIISNIEHHLGLAALNYLLANQPAVQHHLDNARSWTTVWTPPQEPELADAYRRIIEKGKVIADLTTTMPYGPLNDQPMPSEQDHDWLLTSDQMGSFARINGHQYVVHVHPQHGRDEQWRLGTVDQNNQTQWLHDHFDGEPEARQAAANHAAQP